MTKLCKLTSQLASQHTNLANRIEDVPFKIGEEKCLTPNPLLLLQEVRNPGSRQATESSHAMPHYLPVTDMPARNHAQSNHTTKGLDLSLVRTVANSNKDSTAAGLHCILRLVLLAWDGNI